MMSIAGYNSSEYITGVSISTGSSTSSTVTWPLPAGSKASNTTLYQLLFYPFISGYNSTLGVVINPPEHFQIAYASSDLWVLIYKINYTA
jgi:hypothetical protein